MTKSLTDNSSHLKMMRMLRGLEEGLGTVLLDFELMSLAQRVLQEASAVWNKNA